MNFNYPKVTEFYKFLLVEELALCSNPALIHYGNCSVIGHLISRHELGSLTIPNLQKCHQLPDCSLNVRLIMDFYPINHLNSTVEVFGEVKLFDSSSMSSTTDLELESSHSLIQKLRDLQTSLEEAIALPSRPPSGTNDKSLNSAIRVRLVKEIEEFKSKFKPAIKVHTIKHISEAREIIGENLHFRQIQNHRNRSKPK